MNKDMVDIPVRSMELQNDLLYQSVKEMIGEGHTVTIKVKGYSMTPFLINGRDCVELGAFDADRLSKGDIILGMTDYGQVVLHRIISVYGDYVTLRGDGNLKGTEDVLKKNIAGVVKSALRNGEKVDFNSDNWRRLSFVWSFLLPFRRILLFLYKKIF